MDQKNRRTGRAELPAVAPACRRLPEQCQRLLSALVLLPPLLAFLYFAPAAAVAGLVLVLVVLSLKEYFALLQEARLPAYAGTGYAAGVGLVLVAFLGGARWLPAALTGATALLVARGARGRKEAAFPALLYSLFAVWFVAWGASHLVLLRREAEGPWLLFLLCAVVWTGDSVAMYVGKALGRHKLAPAVSPGKTWEGAAGCVGGSVAAALLGSEVLVPSLSVAQRLVLGGVLACAAQLGDLGESMLKRFAGVKDSGQLIPGHGGLLDRLDSMLLAAPAMYYTLMLLSGGAP